MALPQLLSLQVLVKVTVNDRCLTYSVTQTEPSANSSVLLNPGLREGSLEVLFIFNRVSFVTVRLFFSSRFVYTQLR